MGGVGIGGGAGAGEPGGFKLFVGPGEDGGEELEDLELFGVGAVEGEELEDVVCYECSVRGLVSYGGGGKRWGWEHALINSVVGFGAFDVFQCLGEVVV